MLITLEQFEQAVPDSTDRLRAKFLTPLNIALAEFEINTPLRIAAFIAQVAHESGNFRYVSELADGSAYEYRKDLGNLKPEALAAAHACGTTTGKFYKGHGPIQITGYNNHKACGEALGLDLVNEPMLICEPLNGCRAAGWFWKTNNLNPLADKGEFKRITKKINGGYNHLAERERNYDICKIAFNCR